MVKHRQGYRGELGGVLSEHLEDLEFPAQKAEIVTHLRENGLDEALLKVLESLPDRTFEEMREVLDHVEGGTMSTGPAGAEDASDLDRGDEELTGLRHGEAQPDGVGSRNVRDMSGDGVSGLHD